MSDLSSQFGRILSFQSPLASSPETGLALVGGKGANLALLFQAGLPVPDGFLVTTQAYREFVRDNGLEERILAALPPSDSQDPAGLETASQQIRAMFSAGSLPPGLADELAVFYRDIGEPPVAVRSSATAEDLPEMSFAGQQDTFLHVVGLENLLSALVDCWSSLWTARAIGYRARNRVSHKGVALAVVVQRMVESESSGVLFTANPLTGLRGETVIDAAFGLGEALVSGKVEPDHYVVDTKRGLIVEKTLGAKTLSIHGQSSGGTSFREEDRKTLQALADGQVLELAQLGQQVASLYGVPQDIEWALSDGTLYLLQSRAVTSLFPVPENLPSESLKVMLSFGAVQGLLDPITPLGSDALKLIFATGAGLFRINVTSETQTVLYTAGERLWVNVTSLIRNTVGRKVMHVALSMVEPTIQQAIITLWDDPQLQPERQGISLCARLHLASFFLPLAGNIFLNFLSPHKRRETIVANGERIIESMNSRMMEITGTPRQRLDQIASVLPQMCQDRFPHAFVLFVSGVAAGMASLNFIRMLAKELSPDLGESIWSDLVLELTRGVPYNPTTEMDLELWDVARAIHNDPLMLQEFDRHDAQNLAARYQSGVLPPSGQALIAGFLARYGGRGLGEIDLGRPRWSEDPTHVFEVLSSYLLIHQLDQTPDVVFARGAASAQAALDTLCAALRKKRWGWWKARLARFLGGRMRALLGLRERPKFFAVRMMGALRVPLLQVGAELVALGDLNEPDDLFYLSFNELKAFAGQEPRDWKQIIAARREANRRETMRRQVPRLLLSDGRAFYEGIISTGSDANTLAGSPVSPGSAEGDVRVVLNPREANLRPGEILVCPGTDPSWTPLFLSAAGLVMEVGGMMTHGAVVAREYGIPAVVGVDQATHRLQTGQRIRIDGSTGIIQVIR